MLWGTYNSAQAINNRGQTAGSSDLFSSNGYYHAVRWNGKAGTDLGTLGGHSSFAYGINDRGQVVGSSNVNPPTITYTMQPYGTELTRQTLAL